LGFYEEEASDGDSNPLLKSHQYLCFLFFLLDLYVDDRPISLEYLFIHAQLSIGSLTQLLLNMEFKGLIKELPGKRYLKLI
jgi:predicted Rossmann fold nucleotide-binding protein DprA/Smf involved in DNA uptake